MRWIALILIVSPYVRLASCQNPTPPPTPTHEITLQWDAPTSLPAPGEILDGYAVYRALCVGEFVQTETLANGAQIGSCRTEGPFVKLGESSAPSFEDATVSPGLVYSYYVAALYLNDPQVDSDTHIAGLVP